MCKCGHLTHYNCILFLSHYTWWVVGSVKSWRISYTVLQVNTELWKQFVHSPLEHSLVQVIVCTCIWVFFGLFVYLFVCFLLLLRVSFGIILIYSMSVFLTQFVYAFRPILFNPFWLASEYCPEGRSRSHFCVHNCCKFCFLFLNEMHHISMLTKDGRKSWELIFEGSVLCLLLCWWVSLQFCNSLCRILSFLWWFYCCFCIPQVLLPI